MTRAHPQPIGFHLNGSLPFSSTDESLHFIARELGPWVTRVPDGEPGERANWVLTQRRHFFENPAFEVVPPSAEVTRPLVRLKPGVDDAQIRFEPFDYAEYARASYPRFRAARERGDLDPKARFLVSLPTPFNAVSFFVVLEHQVRALAAYERRAREALDGVLGEVPAGDLSIQWDLPIELATLQGWFPNPFADEAALLEGVARASDWVPAEIDFGFHLCYGDTKFGPSPFMGKPSKDAPSRKDIGRNIVPEDASTLVRAINGLSAVVRRPIHFIQAATMREWDTPRHWRALAELRLRPETQLYIGLVHASDGVAGARLRHALVSEHLTQFGVSTECGLGRHSHEQVADVLTGFRSLLEPEATAAAQ